MKDPVYEICELMLRNSPEASYVRLNGALRSTLQNCIAADLPFKPDTFQRIADKLRGGWWFGDGGGSHYGEHFYTTACECNHASAQQSFEKFAGRPAVLWEEDRKTPERLHVGSRFTWKGIYVTVTSMRKDSLVACSYKDRHHDSINGLKVGAQIGYNPRHLITEAKKDGTATILRVVPRKASEDGRQIAKRFTIPYAEIAELRKTAKAQLKAIIKKIETCDPERIVPRSSRKSTNPTSATSSGRISKPHSACARNCSPGKTRSRTGATAGTARTSDPRPSCSASRVIASNAPTATALASRPPPASFPSSCSSAGKPSP